MPYHAEDGIGAIGAHVIEGEFCERGEIGPMGRWEGEVNGRQHSDGVILRCPDRPLGRVSAVLIGRDKLVFYELGAKKLGESFGSFIIEDKECDLMGEVAENF